MFNKSFSKKSFIGASLGLLIEYYDYTLFILFLPIIAKIFFPGTNTYHSLVKSFLILYLTALARPLGGLVFGYIGDTLGRRIALQNYLLVLILAHSPQYLTPLRSFLLCLFLLPKDF
jgi:MFS family permease